MFVYHIFMTSPLWLAGVLSLYKEDYLQIFKCARPFDYTVLAVSGKVEYP